MVMIVAFGGKGSGLIVAAITFIYIPYFRNLYFNDETRTGAYKCSCYLLAIRKNICQYTFLHSGDQAKERLRKSSYDYRKNVTEQEVQKWKRLLHPNEPTHAS